MEIIEKANDISNLIIEGYREILFRIFRREEVNREKEYIKRHESGHALVYLLAGQKIQEVNISILRGDTCKKLIKLFGERISILGKKINLNAGETSLNDEDEKRFQKNYPERQVIMYLAGISNTYTRVYQKYYKKILEKGLNNINEETWKDIKIPAQYIQKRFLSLSGRDPTQKEISNIFYKIIQEISELFSDHDFLRALNIIGNQISNPNQAKNFSDTILNALLQNSFQTSDIFKKMKNKLFAIDIDRIIESLS